MTMYIKTRAFAALFGSLFILLVAFGPVAAMPAHGQITESQVHEQRLVVQGKIVETLREQIKLLQFLVIRRLEAQVAELEAQLTAQ